MKDYSTKARALCSAWLLVLTALWVATPALAQSIDYSTLYSFQGGTTDGLNPYGGLIQASDGNLYGTCYEGGAYGYGGTVFKITPSGTESILYSFKGGTTDGQNPQASLIQASDGNFYGTTEYGGAHTTSLDSYGTVFKITPSGTETVLYSFGSSSTDAVKPVDGLIQASDGNFYGTTPFGGTHDYGTVFKITPSGTETVLYSFKGGNTDGQGPYGGLIQASDGNLYGTTDYGGAHFAGTAFKITPTGTETVLYSFGTSSTDGSNPLAGLIQASDGNFYGTTINGGADLFYGTVFMLTPSGTETILYSFQGGTTDGKGPGKLILGNDGNFYGTAGGGAYGYGTVFMLTPSGTETVLHSFAGAPSDGNYPNSGLIQASDGTFYGTTVLGGAYGTGDGTVFAFSLIGSAPALSKIVPSSTNAGGPAFTLSIYGSNFTSDAAAEWTFNGTPTSLTTTVVSASKLTASVPASLIANPGKAAITVVTSGGTSNSKPFTIRVTTLKLTAASLTKNSNGTYTAKITIKNSGYLSAPNVKITKATLGAAATSNSLPVTIGSIAAGATASTSLTYPASAGSSGQVVSLNVSGTFTGGTFNGSLRVTLP